MLAGELLSVQLQALILAETLQRAFLKLADDDALDIDLLVADLELLIDRLGDNSCEQRSRGDNRVVDEC